MEFNILQEKTVIFLTKYSRKVNNWNSRNARQPTAEWNGFEFVILGFLSMRESITFSAGMEAPSR